MAVEDWPLLRWRMREYTHGRWGTEIVRKNPKLAEDRPERIEPVRPHRHLVRPGAIEADVVDEGAGPPMIVAQGMHQHDRLARPRHDGHDRVRIDDRVEPGEQEAVLRLEEQGGVDPALGHFGLHAPHAVGEGTGSGHREVLNFGSK